MAAAGRASGAQHSCAYAAILGQQCACAYIAIFGQFAAQYVGTESARSHIGTSLQIVRDKGVRQAQEAPALTFR